jgi:hypothetical protein
MTKGRPPKYSPEALEKARHYLASWEASGKQIPTIAGLSLAIGVARETVHAWARDKEKEDFSHIYRELMAVQEETLANKGLRGDFNSTITKLILTKHGYSDKVDQTLGGPGGAPVPLQYIVTPVRSPHQEPEKKEGEDAS